MAGNRILIVEDDGIIALHIQTILSKLGYQIAGIAASGIEAITLAEQKYPDLILMDISLQGDLDGVDVAEQLHRKSDTPIIYLTAYSDEKTLRRAKISDPFGYILKPFDERTLHATIIMALHKHDLEITLKESEERFRNLVQNQGEGLVIVDLHENFTFANPAANEIFGLSENTLEGRCIKDFINPQYLSVIENEAHLRSQGEKSSYEIEIIRPDGETRSLVVVATPWFEKERGFVGTCAILRDVTEQKRISRQEQEQRALAEALRNTTAALTSTLNLDEVLKRILDSIGNVVPHDSATITLIDEKSTRIIGGNEKGLDPASESGLNRFNYRDVFVLNQIVSTAQPLLLNDTTQTDGWINLPTLEWAKSYLGAPLTIHQQVKGVLSLFSASPGFFTPQHLERLNAFVNQAAIALENADLYKEIQERAIYLGLLNDLTTIAIESANFEDMLVQVTERIGKILKADGIYITFWDETQEGTIQAAAYGLDSEHYRRTSGKPQEHTLTASVLKEMRPIPVEDVLDTPYIGFEVASEFPVKSLLGLPLFANGQKLGAMLIGYSIQHHFTRQEIDHGEQVARQVALAMIKGRLFMNERERTRQLTRANELITALAHVAARIEKIPAPQYVMETLGQELQGIGLSCVLSLKNDSDPFYKIAYSTLPMDVINQEPELSHVSFETFQDVFRHSAYYQSMVSKQEAHYLPQARMLIQSLISPQYPAVFIEKIQEIIKVKDDLPMVLLPLIIGDREIGNLWLWGSNLEKSDLTAHSVFASQVAIALENARLYSEVQTMAMTDDLTGLYNRRRLFQIALEEIKRSQQLNKPLSLIIVDLDEFKRVNDTYGHVVGDEVVVEIANRCRQHARNSDLIGRYGGDEFIFLLPDTAIEAAIHVAERTRNLIQNIPIVTSAGDIYITASMGVATVTEESTDLVSLLIRADKSLYSAKQTGRNKVTAI